MRYSFLLLLLLIAACAAPMKPLEFAPPIGLQDPFPGQAVAYLIRAPRDAETLQVFVDAKLVATLPPSTYTAVGLSPGAHKLSAHAASADGQPEKSLPLELTVAASERRFFYVSRPTSTSSSIVLVPGIGVSPVPGRRVTNAGPRAWHEATELDAQGLMSISKVVLPERDAY